MVRSFLLDPTSTYSLVWLLIPIGKKSFFSLPGNRHGMAMGRYLMHNIMTAQRPRAHFFWKDNASLVVSIIQDRDFYFRIGLV